MPRLFQIDRRSKASAGQNYTVDLNSKAQAVESSRATPAASAPEDSLDTITSGANTSVRDKTKNLWDQAFQLLWEDINKRQRLDRYEEIVLSELEVGHESLRGTARLNDQDREDQLAALVSKKLQIIDDARLRIHRGGKAVEVAPQIDRLVKAVLFAKDFISSAAGSEPHVALAWAGISVLLPVCRFCLIEGY